MERYKYAQPRTSKFLEAAFLSGATILAEDAASRDARKALAIAAAYDYMLTARSYREVGRRMSPPGSHERARLHVDMGMRLIWEHCPEQIKEEFPFGSIPMGKPLSSTLAGRNMAESSRLIISAATSGASFEDIRKTTGVNGETITRARITARKYGVDVPYKHRSPEEYLELVEACTDISIPEKKYREAVRSLPLNVLRGLVNNGALISLARMVKHAGYETERYHLTPYRDALREANLLIEGSRVITSGNRRIVQTYYFIALRNIEKGVRVIKRIKPE